MKGTKEIEIKGLDKRVPSQVRLKYQLPASLKAMSEQRDYVNVINSKLIQFPTSLKMLPPNIKIHNKNNICYFNHKNNSIPIIFLIENI